MAVRLADAPADVPPGDLRGTQRDCYRAKEGPSIRRARLCHWLRWNTTVPLLRRPHPDQLKGLRREAMAKRGGEALDKVWRAAGLNAAESWRRQRGGSSSADRGIAGTEFATRRLAHRGAAAAERYKACTDGTMFHFDRGLKLTKADLSIDFRRRQPRGFISHAHLDHMARHELALCTPQTLACITSGWEPGLCSRCPTVSRSIGAACGSRPTRRGIAGVGDAAGRRWRSDVALHRRF